MENRMKLYCKCVILYHLAWMGKKNYAIWDQFSDRQDALDELIFLRLQGIKCHLARGA
jgi:hypothetical protein